MASQRPTGNVLDIIGRHSKEIRKLKKKLSSLSDGVTDHGALTGLTDDDHTHYLLADGSRAMSGSLLLPDGSIPAPSLTFSADTDTGFSRDSSGAFSAVSNGNRVVHFFSSGLVIGGNTLVTGNPRIEADRYTFQNDEDTYLWRNNVNQLSLVAGGTTVAQLLLPDSERARINMPKAASTYIEAYRTGSTDRLILNANDRLNSQIVYNITGAVSANVHVNSAGDIHRATSSLKYKPGWQFVDEDELADLELPTPITWIEDSMRGKTEKEDPHGFAHREVQTMLGFGTEHVAAMLPAAAQDFNREGQPENYDVRALVAILAAKIKRLERSL